MPNRPSYTAGRFYHFYNRGAHRVSIFREPDNYVYVLGRMKRYCRDYLLTIIAYCLLPNHYHFLVRQDRCHSAGLLVQLTFNGYTKAYNRRYGHSGTLFESPYKVRLIDDEAYALTLSCYIHANPVLHGVVPSPRDWPYSNYLEWTGERNGTLVDRDFVEAYYPVPGDYAAAVAAYVAEHQLVDDLEDATGA